MTDQPTDELILVAIWTDGMGTYQARCKQCPWKGAWWRKEARAVTDAEGHITHQEATS